MISKQQQEEIRQERLKETNYNKYGSKMTIVEYKNTHNIVVRFENGYTTECRYDHFQTGEVKSLYDKTICNVAYMGEGKYKSRQNGKMTRSYNKWSNMIRRCYDKEFQKKNSTYENCTVCEEWHNFQNFAKWFDENYYEMDGQRMALDKDILVKGNKIYSPENCLIVPSRINNLFCKTDDKRGDLPIEVYYHKGAEKYSIFCSIYDRDKNKQKHSYLGLSNNLESAFKVYKQFKEKIIKEVAEEYKNLIPTKLYNALYSWVVEITD